MKLMTIYSDKQIQPGPLSKKSELASTNSYKEELSVMNTNSTNKRLSSNISPTTMYHIKLPVKAFTLMTDDGSIEQKMISYILIDILTGAISTANLTDEKGDYTISGFIDMKNQSWISMTFIHENSITILDGKLCGTIIKGSWNAFTECNTINSGDFAVEFDVAFQASLKLNYSHQESFFNIDESNHVIGFCKEKSILKLFEGNLYIDEIVMNEFTLGRKERSLIRILIK